LANLGGGGGGWGGGGPPPVRDREFLRRLALAIGEREKTFGRVRADPRSVS
jgi:hypothetical protein